MNVFRNEWPLEKLETWQTWYDSKFSFFTQFNFTLIQYKDLYYLYLRKVE